MRLKVAEVLAAVGPSDLPALVALQSDPDHDVRFAATGKWIPFPERKRKDLDGSSAVGPGPAVAAPVRLGSMEKKLVDSSQLLPSFGENKPNV